MNYNILIVDDQQTFNRSLSRVLHKEGYSVQIADSGETALAQIEKKPPDLVLLDLCMPQMDGLEVLRRIREISRQIVVIMMSAHGEIKHAVSSIKLGSYDFISKPLCNDFLRTKIGKALEKIKIKKEIEHFRDEQLKNYKGNFIIGESPKIRDVYRTIERLPPDAKVNVLIEGESGTGKEISAYSIHAKSIRAGKPFFAINCAAIPRELLESELFGYEKGAFTSASREGKQGLFEQAGEGTIFLDEIGTLESSLQAKLLRVLETREFYRVGGLKKIQLKACIIAATNRDLKKAVKDGLFREDLYYRLNVVNIYMPPLRERKEDIILFAKVFIDEFNTQFKKSMNDISPEVQKIFMKYNWPGNIRELRNLIERIVLLEAEDIILKEHLPQEMISEQSLLQRNLSINLPENGVILNNLEKEYVKKALEITMGNQMKSARLLGLSRGALRNRVKRYNLG